MFFQKNAFLTKKTLFLHFFCMGYCTIQNFVLPLHRETKQTSLTTKNNNDYGKSKIDNSLY